MAGSISHLQRLLHDMLRDDDGQGLDRLVEGLARAAGAAGAVLWTRAAGEVTATPSVVARWSADPAAESGPHRVDPVTVAAFRTRTLVLPDETGVLAALPVDGIDGDAGVLTLLGPGELGTAAFDVIVDLLDVLPELCRMVRERQGLALVRRCNDILHDADMEAAEQILSPERLSHHLGLVCGAVSEALRCREVSIHLRDPASAEATFPLIATSAAGVAAGAPVVAGVGPVGEAIEFSTPVVEPNPGCGGACRMAAPVCSGGQVSGAISCTGTTEPRSHFTPPDVAVLTSVTGQIARFWTTWLRRRTSDAENESWRLLAAGVTDLNKLLSEQLGRRRPDDDRVYRAAADLVATVVSGHDVPEVAQIVNDQLGLYMHLRQTLTKLQDARTALGRIVTSQAEALEDLQHQLVSPLLVAARRTDRLLRSRHLDSRTDLQLRAVRGLCRKSSRVAMSAGVFAALSKGETLRPKLDLLSVDDLLPLLIAGADDAQMLSDPRRNVEFTVDRDTVRALGRRLFEADRSFLEQCVGNLVDNAAKYSYENTRVAIGAVVDDGGFSVAVTNVGLALDPADAERCLQRNWRGPAARGAAGEGSGIGLWIVDHLMRCMKGRVDIRPSDDTTTVLLTFPLR